MIPSITCPHCHRTSSNPNDVREGYCGHCHRFLADDARLVELVALELARKEPMALGLRPETVFYLTGLVQLALRHPTLPVTTRECGERFVVAVREYFADCPAALDLVRRGDDPTEDR
jgi:hypothetical protein